MKDLINIDNILKNDNLVEKCRNCYSNIKSLKEFGFYCNCNVFIYLFGENEGTRLWLSFVEDTNRDIYKMLFEYLSNDQAFILIANILENKDLKMSIYN